MTMPRGRHGDLISWKNDETACLAYDELLFDHDNYIQHMSKESYAEELAYVKQWAHDENDTCTCNPRHYGLVWSKVMSVPCDMRVDDFMGWEVSNQNLAEYNADALNTAWYHNRTNAEISAW